MTRRAWLQFALVCALGLSVTANAFLLGFAMRSRDGGRDLGLLGQDVLQVYPAQVRAELRDILSENRPRIRDALHELRQARLSLAREINAEEPDEAKVRLAMEEVRRATTALQALVQEQLLEALMRSRPNR